MSKMSRFKTSKYKNAYSYVYRKEFWVNDLHVGSDLKGSGNHVSASVDFQAFVHDSKCVGGFAVLPLSSHGRFTQFPVVAGHSGTVTDFTFSPFHSDLLASGAEDCLVKLWKLPEEFPLDAHFSTPFTTLGPLESPVEALLFHPVADNLLAVASGKSVKIWDINRDTVGYDLTGFGDVVQSVSWHGSGEKLAAMCKDGRMKKLHIIDPRTDQRVSDIKVHNAVKDAQVLWLGDTNMLVTAGFSPMRNPELALWDLDNLSKPLTKIALDTTTTGSPMMFYDEDTKMLFVALKSESKMMFYEVSNKSPHLVQGSDVLRSSNQTKGMTMVPKRAVDVMSCQVARFLQLTQNAVVPVSYHVQRKGREEFHEDLFPDTRGDTPAVTGEEWCSGQNGMVAKVSLDPSKRRPTKTSTSTQSSTSSEKKKKSEERTTTPSTTTTTKASPPHKPKPPKVATPPLKRETPPSSPSAASGGSLKSPKSPKALNLVRSSKYRHISGEMLHRSLTIDKIPSLSSTVPGDSNAFQANRDRVAVALATAGGQIGVFELSKAGRLDKEDVPTLQNVSNVMDFAFDPFDNHRLVVACEDARIKVWSIPKDGLTQTVSEPEFCLIGHQEKANVLAFHPQASSLLASAGYDGQLLLWNLETQEIALQLDPLPQPLFTMAWSPDGRQLATMCKDHQLRLYTPRSSTSPVAEGRGPDGSRGARIVWLDNSTFAVSGFDKASVRTISVYAISSLEKPKAVLSTNVSPATLLPFFDRDTSVLFLSGKGDTNVVAFEYVPDEHPYLFNVAPFICPSAHQSIVFLPKVLCDVKRVEIARVVRLTKSTVDHFVIKVPRTKMNYFQDDIYVDTLVSWKPALTVKDWLQGKDALQSTVSLRPSGMKLLSEAPKEAPAAKKFASYNPNIKTDDQKKEELLSAMIDRMGDQEDDPLPQTTMDGCDSDEWSD